MAHKELFRQGARQQAMADALASQAMTPTYRQQGRIAANTGAADALTTVLTALASRRTGRKAQATLAQAEEEKRQAQAEALSRMSRPQNYVETREAQSPFTRAQGALEAEVDPAIVSAYMQQKTGTGKSPFGVVDPGDFTPESLAKFNETGNYGDLVPSNNMFGKYTPSNYTTESWAKFSESGNPADLVLRPQYRTQESPGGGLTAVNTTDPTKNVTIRTPEEGTAEAAARAAAEAEAKTTGESRGGLKSVRLEAAQRRLERVRQASEALTVGGPVIGTISGVTPKGQDLNQANAQLMTELTALTRVPGVGSQSDLEQRLAQLQLPTPEMYPTVRAKAITELEAFMRDLDSALGSVSDAASTELPDFTKMSDEQLRRLASGAD